VRNLALLRRLNSTVRTGLLAGAVVLTEPLRAQTPPDLQTVMSRATDGDVESQHALGAAYDNGTSGAARDYAEAMKWYRRAADKGFALAQYSVGLAFEQGRGVPADPREAFKYFLLAAEQGYTPAQFNVGNMYAAGRGVGQDFFEANLWFRQAADNGLVEAQFNLGFAYEAGHGVKKDESQAARWYKQAAERGYARAQYNLGLLLEDGRGVARDAAAAATLYRAAAEQGFVPAQVNYGVMLSEGGSGVPADPVQAYVWLSRAAQNGAGAEARDKLARTLTSEQIAAATSALRDGTSPEARSPAPSIPVVVATPTATPARSADSGGNLVAQLREQSRRLAGQVESLTADKEAAERQAAVLSTQIRDLQQDLQQLRSSGGSPAVAPAGDTVRFQGEIKALSARLEQTAGALRQVEQANAQLTEANRRLQQEKEALPAAQPAAADGRVEAGGPPAYVVANLQRDNARLNDEVKRATRELLSLNSQLRSLRNQTTKSAVNDAGDNTPDLQARLAETRQIQENAVRLETENRRLNERIAELEKTPTPTSAPAVGPTQEQVAALSKEKADLEQWSQSLEKSLNEKSAAGALLETTAARLSATNKELNERLARAEDSLKATASIKSATGDNDALRRRLEQELAAARTAREEGAGELAKLQTDLAAANLKAAQLGSTVGELTRARTELQAQLAAAQGDTTNVGALRDELVRSNARISELQRDLAAIRQQTANSGTGSNDLKQQLAEANQALEKSGATVAELTVANEKLEHELAAAGRAAVDSGVLGEELARLRRGAAELATLREENGNLRKGLAEAATLRTRNEQLTRDNERLANSTNSNRGDLEKAQARVDELEKQLADALTVRTRGGNEGRRLQGELDEANRSIEKLNATVAEVTAANEKLEKDLDNAQKSTAAALAAQSQAVNAASPDAFQTEISTLNSRIKQLESQVEEERSGAAREVATLASQLQRTRETNKSLTDANRALVSAKENDTSAVHDEIARLEGRVKELTAANDELRRAGQKQISDLRGLAAERENLQSQLVDARKVATVLPGLEDEKVALQERLEATGSQMVQLQREHEELQKANADLTAQLAASRQVAEKARSELAAVQAQTTEAEKAAEAHNTSVAELTQANTRLETERDDMRRLVESYRGDIARLTQTVRAAEQQKTDAERSGQQNVDAVTAQMAQLRRELDAARANQARLAEAYGTQERERAATISQLRTENGALAARLNQAQGTLDQIAAAARLGTPAASIAAGGMPPVRPAPVSAAEVRFHTVAEGDSLSRISMRYYGTANRWQEIFQANRDVLQGNSALRIGMQLRIP
jgi:TPR repeat protein/nucleoid-associated protein YgaU